MSGVEPILRSPRRALRPCDAPSAIPSVATIMRLQETVRSPVHCDEEANVAEYLLLGLR
jgi:hypothetical protein